METVLNTFVMRVPWSEFSKKKAGIFDSPQIRKLMRDDLFVSSMKQVEYNAWSSFVLVVENFLGENNSCNYVELVNSTLVSYKQLNAYMSIKVYLIFSQLEKFPENIGSVNDEQGERFHQDMRDMEKKYQGR